MMWHDGLEGKALKIAQSSSKRIRVIAGPGTGKTFAIKRRILRLIEEEKVQPEKILVLTFTRTAAADLKKELHELGVQNAQLIKAMTLHAFCLYLLKQEQVFEILKRIPRPLKSFTSKGSPQFELSPLLADVSLNGNFGDKREKFKLIKAFEAAWARKQKDTPGEQSLKDRQFKDAIINWLKIHQAILIGELVPLALEFSVKEMLDDVVSGNAEIKNISEVKESYLDLLNNLLLLKDKSSRQVTDILFPENQEEVKILRESCLLYIEKNPECTIEELWNYVEVLLTQPESPDSGDYIRIMSLHKSKGLTSKVTIITSCIEGLIPRREDDILQQEANESLKEQRRLFYVAMTRAKDYLIISSFATIAKKLAHQIGAETNSNTYRSANANTVTSQSISEAKLKVINGDEWRKKISANIDKAI